MSLMDGLLLTLLNTVACLVLPKILSVVLAKKTKPQYQIQQVRESSPANAEMPGLVDAV
ncbi:hypothetical protein [Nostoc sp. FACHB-110]|uniref:hypothetical protein n=1 Tax=Nostoc sp. FACHB-110 TaxID=2692834 RepID=UPI001682EED8|nr:hypothetical protein [Nostoc sp. FACHB-110]MBD2439866.1 hypothetical protein [Nostoc sp. FACHB-110]